MHEKQSKRPLVQYLQPIYALMNGVVVPLVILFSGWNSISSWERDTILVLVALVALVYIIVPAQRWTREKIELMRERREQRLLLQELALLLRVGRFLFDPDLSYSLRHYVNSIRTALIQNQGAHAGIEKLAERLSILGDWHWSLLTFANAGFGQKTPFTGIVRDVSRMYRDTADVVRELASTEFPADHTLRAYSDQQRMTKEKYNQHIGSLEQLLERIATTNPELPTGAFHRF